MPFPRIPWSLAWFLSWFHLVPEVAKMWNPRNPSRQLGSCLGSAWFQRLQKHVIPEIQAGWLGSCLGSTWFQKLQKYVVPERRLEQERANKRIYHAIYKTSPCKSFFCLAGVCTMAKAAANRQLVGHKGAKATRSHYVVAVPCGKEAKYVIPVAPCRQNSK